MQLNILDFLVIADAVYANGIVDIGFKLGNATEGTPLDDFILEDVEPWQRLARTAVIYFPKLKKRIFAIRGTQIQDDILADMDLMAVVALLNGANEVLPLES